MKTLKIGKSNTGKSTSLKKMQKIEMPECWRNVIPASLVLPLVRNISPASTSVRYRWSRTSPAVPSYDYRSGNN
jgi:hypothetical protein